MLTAAQRKTLIETALGRRPLDLVIDNVQVVNVYTGRVEPGAIGIKEGRIISARANGLETERVFDGGGRYAVPGFIDAHVHLDSSLVTPENLSSLIVPRGTSVMLADPMESANVGGYQGLEALLHMRDRLPYHLFVEVSSRVPTAPGLETTGGELGLREVEQVLQWEAAVSLGELDPSKVLGLRHEYLQKVEAAHRLGKIANGHAAGLSGRELEAYLCGGLTDDHECVDFEEAFERLTLGMPIFVREGSTERNLVPIIKGVVENDVDTRHMMFCTDDKHPDDILEEGHIDFMVNTAIELGLSPIAAIQMASVNAAVHFRIDHELGSLSPGRWADVVLSDELTHIRPTHVFFKGQLAAEEGRLAQTIPQANYPDWFYHTVTVSKGKEAEDFRLEAGGDTAHVRVINLYPDQIINEISEATLPVRDGNVVADPDQDVLKIAVVERYGRNGNVGVSFVKGFGLKRGALASSVAHDHHNIIVVGANEEDMALCVRAIETNQGGLTIAAGGALLGTLPLPLGGLMSEKPVQEVIEKLEEITEISHQLGGVLPAPFMTISFIGLPTVPELGLTDKGLVSVRQHSLLSPFVE